MSAIGLHRLGLIVAAFVLQTALLRAGLPGPDEAQARPSLVGQLLVAAPGVGDPRFERTVILIVERGRTAPSGSSSTSRSESNRSPASSRRSAKRTATLRAACASSRAARSNRKSAS
jgi:hypothetical protein